jgi:hypothetical protein
MEQIFNDADISFDDIFYPPNWIKPQKPKSRREYKLTTISQLVKILDWWVNEKVELDSPVFWFYAYSYGPCKRRVIHAVGGKTISDLITEFNDVAPAIAAEIKRLASNLTKEAIEWDKHARIKQQSQCWIDLSPLKVIYVNPIEVKNAASALLDKLQHIGSMVKVKKPSKEAIEAYSLVVLRGFRQTNAAKMMTREHKRKIEQYQIFRWVEQVKKYYEAVGLPVESPQSKPNVITTDPNVLDMGERTDGKRAGDPRHKRQ